MKIMIIDDEEDILYVLGYELRALGHTVETFTSAAEAKTRLASGEGPDVIVCDFQMPKMNGLELFTWAREHGHTGKFHVLTGEPTMDTGQLLEAGINDVFFKPDDLKRLISSFK